MLSKSIEQYRPLLFSIAYNMLGSVVEAEDLVQDCFLVWEELDQSQIQNHKAYLCRIVANRSVDALERIQKERAAYFGTWVPEPLFQKSEGGLDIDRKYQLSMGFMVLLEKLNAVERTVYVLREVFDFSYEVIAEIISKTESNCRQIFKRAKQHIQHSPKRFTPSTQLQEMLAKAFKAATEKGEMAPFIALLQEDVELFSDGGGKVPSLPKPLFGKERCAQFITAVMDYIKGKFEAKFTIANACPTILSYVENKLSQLIVIELSDTGIRGIYIIRNPEKLAKLASYSKTYV